MKKSKCHDLVKKIKTRQNKTKTSPDSALEECSEAEWDSDRCLFFFEWLSSSSDSDP